MSINLLSTNDEAIKGKCQKMVDMVHHSCLLISIVTLLERDKRHRVGLSCSARFFGGSAHSCYIMLLSCEQHIIYFIINL